MPETAVMRSVHTVSNQIPVVAAEKPEAYVQDQEISIEERETLGFPTVNEQMAAGSTPSAYLGAGSEESKFREGF